jgi:hypothetical protein
VLNAALGAALLAVVPALLQATQGTAWAAPVAAVLAVLTALGVYLPSNAPVKGTALVKLGG